MRYNIEITWITATWHLKSYSRTIKRNLVNFKQRKQKFYEDPVRTYFAGHVNMSWHNAHLTLPRLDDAGTVGPY